MSKQDFLPIKGWDHVEFYVGNARQAAHFYHKVFGFKPVARMGLETGCRDRASYALQQGNVRLVFTSSYTPDSEVARHCALHGDGVKVIALEVSDCEAAISAAHARQAQVIQRCEAFEDADGVIKTGILRYAGDTVIKLVERTNYRGPFAPGYQKLHVEHVQGVGMAAIDHIVTNVYLGEMDYWARWFERVMGFSQLTHFTEKDISTEYSALMSKVMENGSGKIKLPINEPAEGKRKSQIDEYLEAYNGPGVQHIAMNTADICKTVSELRARDVDFLRVPDAYYDDLKDRVGHIDEDFEEIKRLGILVDRDDDGYLLQIFSQPVQDRPTVFFEVIERHGSRGFGVGNFKALFVALEAEQARRGNL
ncbi:MAG: 4-hydroxyphenylpyruvate dioxygenase [Phycisphaerales bacterium]|nr:4-hydroxyphenylpyruvate dioxygenase [Phycisphaerales bacterium]